MASGSKITSFKYDTQKKLGKYNKVIQQYTDTGTGNKNIQNNIDNVEEIDVSDSGTYQIQSGDTLSSIARENNVTVEELVEANSIDNPDYIETGWEIDIPGNYSKVSQNSSNGDVYVVQPGDTLSAIARKNNVTLEELVEVNNVSNPDYIEIGQEINIPTKKNDEAISLKQEEAKSQDDLEHGYGDDVLVGLSSGSKVNKDLNDAAKEDKVPDFDSAKAKDNFLVQKAKDEDTTRLHQEAKSQDDLEHGYGDDVLVGLSSGSKVNKDLNDAAKEDKGNIEQSSGNVIYLSEVMDKNHDRVNCAKKIYSSEYNNAVKKYSSDNTFMTIKNDSFNGYNFRITHIVINDPSQIKNIQSNDQYATGAESIYSMTERTDDLVVAATGGFFTDNGKQNLKGANNLVIYNGELVDTKSGIVTAENYYDKLNTVAGGNEICIDKNGKIFYAPEGASAKELIDEYDVVNTFTSHEAKRLNNGQIIQTDEYSKEYDRTYLCMKEPGEYYLVQGYSTPKVAMEYAVDELGCTFAGSLEQGSAVSLVTKNEIIQSHSGYEGIGNAFAIVDK